MQQSLVIFKRSLPQLVIGCIFILYFSSNAASAALSYSSFTYSVTGQGQDVVMIPGLMSDGRIWDGAVAALSSKHRVHVINIAGFGKTPTIKTNTVDKVKVELNKYISKLDKPLLIGHSLGGFLALSLAIENPAAVGGIVSVDGLPFIGPVFTQNSNTKVSDLSAQARFLRAHYAGLSKEQLRTEVVRGINIQAASSANRKFILDMSSLSDPKTVGEMLSALMMTDLRPSLYKLENIRVTLLGASGAMPSELRKDQLEAIYTDQFMSLPSSKVIVNRNTRHFIMLDDLDWLLEQINIFIGAES